MLVLLLLLLLLPVVVVLLRGRRGRWEVGDRVKKVAGRAEVGQAVRGKRASVAVAAACVLERGAREKGAAHVAPQGGGGGRGMVLLSIVAGVGVVRVGDVACDAHGDELEQLSIRAGGGGCVLVIAAKGESGDTIVQWRQRRLLLLQARHRLHAALFGFMVVVRWMV